MAELVVDGLQVRRPDREGGAPTLVRGPNFTLKGPDAIALMGPSGSGKSTLLAAIADLLPRSAGHLRLDGQSIDAMAPTHWRRRVLYLHQQAFLGDETVADALARPFSYASAHGHHFDRATAQDALAALGLPDDVLARHVRKLSVGERQRVALLRAVLLRPAVLLADEPTSALDRERTLAVEQWLTTQLAQGPTALLLVTHDLTQAKRLTQRLVHLAPHAPSPMDTPPVEGPAIDG